MKIACGKINLQNFLRIFCMVMLCTIMNLVQLAYAADQGLSDDERIISLEELQQINPEAYAKYIDSLLANRGEKAVLHVRVIHNTQNNEFYMLEHYANSRTGARVWNQYHIDGDGNMAVIKDTKSNPQRHKNFDVFRNSGEGSIDNNQLDVHERELGKQRANEAFNRAIVNPAPSQSPAQPQPQPQPQPQARSQPQSSTRAPASERGSARPQLPPAGQELLSPRGAPSTRELGKKSTQELLEKRSRTEHGGAQKFAPSTGDKAKIEGTRHKVTGSKKEKTEETR